MGSIEPFFIGVKGEKRYWEKGIGIFFNYFTKKVLTFFIPYGIIIFVHDEKRERNKKDINNRIEK